MSSRRGPIPLIRTPTTTAALTASIRSRRPEDLVILAGGGERQTVALAACYGNTLANDFVGTIA
jgi:hypothetical protein